MQDAATRFQRICAAQIARGDAGRDWVTARLNEALDEIAAGAGNIVPLKSGAANGKNFAGDIHLTSIEIADVAQAALDEADGKGSGPNGITTPSFGSECAQNSDAWPWLFLP